MDWRQSVKIRSKIRANLHIRKLLIFTTLALCIGIFVFWKFSQPAIASWFDDNWAFRKAIPVTNNTTAETNVYISVTVDTSSTASFQAHCEDVRFTDQGGNLLSYFLLTDNCRSGSSVFHVLLANFPAGAQTFYVYYGNPAALKGSVAADFATQASNYTVGTLAAEEKAPGPTAYWNFDDGQSLAAQDSSINNNDGTLGGTTIPTWQTEDQCVSGKCLFFDGSTSKVTGSVIIKNVQSISFWIRPNTIATQGLIDLGGGTHISTNGSGVISATGFTSPTYYINGIQTTTPTLVLNQWNHVEITTGTGFDSTATFTVGTDGTNFIKGFIDEFKVYPYARTTAQIKTDFASRGSVKGVSAQLGGTDQSYLSNGLMGYWKMNEASANGCGTDDSCDSSGNSNNGAWIADATSTSGKFGNGVNFDGTGDYVNVPDNNSLDLTTNLTISSWVNVPSLGLDQSIISKWSSQGGIGNQYSYGLSIIDTNQIYFIFDGNGNPYSGAACQITSTDTSLGTNTWHLVTATYNRGTVKLYQDGRELATTTAGSCTTSIYSGTAPFNIGSVESGNFSFFTGKLDEVRIYNRTFSPKEVADLYNWASGPVGYWKMEEGSGTTISDSSSNGYNSSAFTGDVAFTTGKYGKGLTFDGVNDVVRIPEGTFTDLGALTDSYTVSAWICPKSAGGIVEKSTGTGSFKLGLSGGGAAFLQLMGGAFPAATGTTALIPSSVSCAWHHVAGVRNVLTDTIYIYVDGKLENSANDTIAGSLVNNDDISIGNGGASYLADDYKGIIDEVKIYNYARTQKQIVSDMNADHPAVGSPVGSSVAYWEFDEGALNTCTSGGSTDFCDKSINANHLAFSTTTGGYTDSGKFGKAFNGTGAVWASKADDSDFDVVAADDYAISLWFKSTSATNPGASEYLLDKGTTIGYSIFADTNGKINFSIFDGTGTDTATSNSDIYDATWHHIVATKTGTSRIDIFVDGKISGSDTVIAATGTLANGSSLFIADKDGVDNGDEFNGFLDEVKIYRYALTASEVKTELNYGQSIQLGSLGNNTTYQIGAENQEYCVPGDATSCVSPLIEWRLEEQQRTVIHDTSGNGNTGALASLGIRTQWTKGKIGGAVSFDGSATNGIHISSTSTLTPPTQVTLESWIYPTSLGGGVNLTGFINGFSSGGYFTIIGGTNKLRFRSIFSTTNGSWFTADNSIVLNKWQHLAISYDASSTSNVPSIYINGILQTLDSASTVNPVGTWTSTTGTFYVGDHPTSGITFGGKIDEFKMFNYIRTPAQIAYDYNKGKPVAYWDFDECQGSTINDQSGNSYTGTITVTSTLGTCNTASTFWGGSGGTGAGKRNYAPTFNGTGDFITTSAFSPLAQAGQTTTKFSWGGWFYPITSAVSKTLLEKATEFQLITDANSMPICGVYYAGAFHNSTAPTTALTLSAWNHVLCTYDGTNINTYLNGKLIKQSAETTAIATVSSILYIAETSGGANRYSGQIDDVQIYNFALTSTQVKNLTNNGAVNYAPVTGTP